MTINRGKEPIRVGFIGGGLDSAIGRAHFGALHIDRRFSLDAGMFSIDKSANHNSGDFYGVDVSRVYENISDFLDAERINLDAVIALVLLLLLELALTGDGEDALVDRDLDVLAFEVGQLRLDDDFLVVLDDVDAGAPLRDGEILLLAAVGAGGIPVPEGREAVLHLLHFAERIPAGDLQ